MPTKARHKIEPVLFIVTHGEYRLISKGKYGKPIPCVCLRPVLASDLAKINQEKTAQ